MQYMTNGGLSSRTVQMVFSPQHESWRKHPMLQAKYRNMFPGLGYATAIFATYCACEWVYLRINPKSHHH